VPGSVTPGLDPPPVEPATLRPAFRAKDAPPTDTTATVTANAIEILAVLDTDGLLAMRRSVSGETGVGRPGALSGSRLQPRALGTDIREGRLFL
jgi:hypothetical protein